MIVTAPEQSHVVVRLKSGKYSVCSRLIVSVDLTLTIEAFVSSVRSGRGPLQATLVQYRVLQVNG